MLNVFDYIENYCKVNGIETKSFKSSVLTLDDVSKPLTFAPGIAFFYRTRAVGEIHDITNLNKEFLLVETPTDLYDFAKIGSVYDDGALQRIESDFIFIADNTMKIKLSQGTATSIFNNITALQMFYIYVSILPNCAELERRRNAKIYDITINR